MNEAKLSKRNYIAPMLETYYYTGKDIVTASGAKLSWGNTWGDGWEYFEEEGGNT